MTDGKPTPAKVLNWFVGAAMAFLGLVGLPLSSRAADKTMWFP